MLVLRCALGLLALTLIPAHLDAQCNSPPPKKGGSSNTGSGGGSGSTGSGRPVPLPRNGPSPTTGSPATPRPQAPQPQQSNPTTPSGNPRGPTTGGPKPVTGPITPRGFQLVLTRGRTSQDRLRVAWDYPVGDAERQRTVTFDDTLDRLRRGDRRPLLILRECEHCAGSDDAVLSRSLSNERTLTMARWFHCVKLPSQVLQAEHPFAALFAGDEPPHLLLISADGKDRQPFTGRQKPADLQQAMETLLARDYRKSAKPAVKELLRLLDRFDELDASESQLKDQLDAGMIKAGAGSAEVKRLVDRLAGVQAEKRRVLDEERRAADLELRG